MILEKIADRTKQRVDQAKKIKGMRRIRDEAEGLLQDTGFPFEKALKNDDFSFICEIKKASPSKGIIAEAFPYLAIAKDYESAGASAISVLTEPYFFMGSDQYLSEIAQNVALPILRKDFTIDAYQIYEAKLLGASAVLLIAALLDTAQLTDYLAIAHNLGLSALVEAHNAPEIGSSLRAGARVIGVNNRNLKDFTVDIHNSIHLRTLVPPDILFIAESGIKTPEDIALLKGSGIHCALIGEALMRSPDKKAMLDALKGKADEN